jgi:hypothetical protein
VKRLTALIPKLETELSKLGESKAGTTATGPLACVPPCPLEAFLILARFPRRGTSPHMCLCWAFCFNGCATAAMQAASVTKRIEELASRVAEQASRAAAAPSAADVERLEDLQRTLATDERDMQRTVKVGQQRHGSR